MSDSIPEPVSTFASHRTSPVLAEFALTVIPIIARGSFTNEVARTYAALVGSADERLEQPRADLLVGSVMRALVDVLEREHHATEATRIRDVVASPPETLLEVLADTELALAERGQNTTLRCALQDAMRACQPGEPVERSLRAAAAATSLARIDGADPVVARCLRRGLEDGIAMSRLAPDAFMKPGAPAPSRGGDRSHSASPHTPSSPVPSTSPSSSTN